MRNTDSWPAFFFLTRQIFHRYRITLQRVTTISCKLLISTITFILKVNPIADSRSSPPKTFLLFSLIVYDSAGWRRLILSSHWTSQILQALRRSTISSSDASIKYRTKFIEWNIEWTQYLYSIEYQTEGQKVENNNIASSWEKFLKTHPERKFWYWNNKYYLFSGWAWCVDRWDWRTEFKSRLRTLCSLLHKYSWNCMNSSLFPS